jgi:EmrB/QacA subfamily drug resistance transporter
MLNLCRALQGVGGAVMFATSLALIANAFVGRDRGTAFGIYGAVIGGAVAIGPLIGGAITSAWGWRWIFFVNVPIGVLAIFITFAQIARSKDPQPHRVDWIGFVTFSASLFTLVFALVRGNDLGWSSATIVTLLVASGALMVAFFVNEKLAREPMLDLGLFKIPAFAGLSIVAFTIAASIFAMFLYLTLYIQDDLGFSPLAAGIKFLPLTLLSFAVAPISGRLLVRVQSRYLLGVGMLLITGGLLAMSRTTPTSAWTVLLPGFILCGIGIGTVNPALANGAISVVQPQRSGMASGANNTFRQVGIATGIAVLGAVFQSQIIAHTTAALNKTADGVFVLRHGGSSLHGALSAGQVQQAAQHIPVAGARNALVSAYHVGFSTTLNHLMIIGAVVAFVGVVGALTLVRQRDFVVPSSPGAPAPGAEGGAPTEDAALPAVHA